MPLTYDDVPGSWGVYSEGWPSISFSTEDKANRAFIACTKAKVVPYGSYVMMDNSIRLETKKHKEALAKYLEESPHKTFEELKQHFIEKGMW